MISTQGDRVEACNRCGRIVVNFVVVSDVEKSVFLWFLTGKTVERASTRSCAGIHWHRQARGRDWPGGTLPNRPQSGR